MSVLQKVASSKMSTPWLNRLRAKSLPSPLSLTVFSARRPRTQQLTKRQSWRAKVHAKMEASAKRVATMATHAHAQLDTLALTRDSSGENGVQRKRLLPF